MGGFWGDTGWILGVLGSHSQGFVRFDVGAQAQPEGPAPFPHPLGVPAQRGLVQGQRRGGQLLQGGSQPRAGNVGRGRSGGKLL